LSQCLCTLSSWRCNRLFYHCRVSSPSILLHRTTWANFSNGTCNTRRSSHAQFTPLRVWKETVRDQQKCALIHRSNSVIRRYGNVSDDDNSIDPSDFESEMFLLIAPFWKLTFALLDDHEQGKCSTRSFGCVCVNDSSTLVIDNYTL
jgi:hypothetical protein